MRKLPRFAKLPVVALALCAGLTSLSHISEARAQEAAAPTDEQKAAARAAYGAGEAAYDSGDYATARTKFQEADRTIPSIFAKFWAGMALAETGDPSDALAELEAVVSDDASKRLGAEKLEMANAKIKELKQKLPATVQVETVPPGALLLIDGEERGKSPKSLEVAPGVHQLSISLEGYEPQIIELDAKAGETATREVTLKEVPAEPQPTEPAEQPVEVEEEERSLVPAYVTLGVAGASAIVGTIFGLQALSAQSDFDDNPTQDSADDAERNALIADMAFGVTLTLGITGIVLLTADDDSELSAERRDKKTKSQARLDVAPYFSPKGGGAAARLTF